MRYSFAATAAPGDTYMFCNFESLSYRLGMSQQISRAGPLAGSYFLSLYRSYQGHLSTTADIRARVAPSWPAPPNGRIIPHPARLCQPLRVQPRPGCQPLPVMISCAADLPPQSIMTVAMQQQKYWSRGSRCSRQQKKADSRNRLAPECGGCPLVVQTADCMAADC